MAKTIKMVTVIAVLHYRLRWFAVSDREMEVYKKLGVKKWKNRMPTFDSGAFNKGIHSWDEIAQATC